MIPESPVESPHQSADQTTDQNAGAGLPTALAFEEALLNSWPAHATLLRDGWLMRFGHGYSKRANSASRVPGQPIYPVERLGDQIAAAQHLYSGRGLQSIFRLTSMSDPERTLDRQFAQLGYERLDLTEVLCLGLPSRAAPLSALADATQGRHRRRGTAAGFVKLDQVSWWDAHHQLAELDDRAAQRHLQLLRRIPLHCTYGAVATATDEVLALGLMVLDGNRAGIFDVITRPDSRRTGLGRRLMTGLLTEAARQGAKAAYLGVLSDNTAARNLYQDIGFEPSYQYWYRRQRASHRGTQTAFRHD